MKRVVDFICITRYLLHDTSAARVKLSKYCLSLENCQLRFTFLQSADCFLAVVVVGKMKRVEDVRIKGKESSHHGREGSNN